MNANTTSVHMPAEVSFAIDKDSSEHLEEHAGRDTQSNVVVEKSGQE